MRGVGEIYKHLSLSLYTTFHSHQFTPPRHSMREREREIKKNKGEVGGEGGLIVSFYKVGKFFSG